MDETDAEKAAKFAAAAAAHCTQQTGVLTEAIARLRDKAARFDQLAAQVRADIKATEEALAAIEAEQAEWAGKAHGRAVPEPTETTSADAGVAEAAGEAKL
jgi:hypothetical protein